MGEFADPVDAPGHDVKPGGRSRLQVTRHARYTDPNAAWTPARAGHSASRPNAHSFTLALAAMFPGKTEETMSSSAATASGAARAR